MAPDLIPAAFSSASAIPGELIAECQRMAAEAACLARETTGEVRSAYVRLSEQWASLANELEDFAAGHLKHSAPPGGRTASTS
jgi:hypothetical protein